MSPRAAWRLEQLGYDEVHDYVGGKLDWLAFMLPREGEASLVADHVDTDVPVCTPGETAREAIGRLDADTDRSIVVNDAGVVQGVLDRHGVTDPSMAVADQLRFGITTVRPSEDVHELDERMEAAEVTSIVVTRPDGSLVGLHRAGQR